MGKFYSATAERDGCCFPKWKESPGRHREERNIVSSISVAELNTSGCQSSCEDGQSVADAGAALFQLMLDTASGTRTRSEEHGMGDNEFVPWHLGAVM